jgi:tetratricopeptide (TPR) repeat protein
MTAEKTASVILPSWRQGRLLFFVSVVERHTNRLAYRVAAATPPKKTRVLRSFKAPLTADDLAKCQQTADDGVGLQRFFHRVASGNLEALTAATGQDLPPCAAGTDTLLYICAYFDFLRKYSVDQALVQRYEAQAPAARFNPEASLTIYKILSAHLQPGRAGALIDADLPDINTVSGAPRTVANLLRKVAIIRYDTGDPAAAMQAMLKAITLHNSVDKWRRLADFAIADNNPEKAIEYFLTAERMAPLAPPLVLRLANLLVEAGRAAEAAPFLDRIEPVFKTKVERLRAMINHGGGPA